MSGSLRRPPPWASVALVLIAAPLLVALHFGDTTSSTVDWPLAEFAEPSGIVYHPERKTLFLVGDEGDIGEVSLEGGLLRQFHLGGDLEAITVDPSTGLLYVVREGHEVIFELRPDDFRILRRFTIDRTFGEDPNFLRRGGDGIEGLALVADANSPEGGAIWAVNQYDPPVLIELEMGLKSSKEKFQTARIRRAIPVDSAPLSDLAWDPRREEFLVASALWKRVVVLDAAGRLLRQVRIPAFMPEGLARLPDGRWVIAQDTGGLVAWTPDGDPFEEAVAAGEPAPSGGSRSETAAPLSLPAVASFPLSPAQIPGRHP